jgi:hypothetical protein
MKESRKITIANKRFSMADVMAIAALFTTAVEDSKFKGGRPEVSFEVLNMDGTRFEADQATLFSEDGVIGLRPPKAIEMSYGDYKLGRRMTFAVSHGGSYSDAFAISGTDTAWVRSTFLGVRERIDALESTENWFTRHPGLTAFIGVLGLGSLEAFCLDTLTEMIVVPALRTWPPSPATIKSLQNSELLQLGAVLSQSAMWSWIRCFLLGGLPWGYFKPWFYSAFPSIDLQLGPSHQRLDEVRRRRIIQFAMIVILPILVNVVYDVMKARASRVEADASGTKAPEKLPVPSPKSNAKKAH